jgi:hypothetical protein
VWATLLTVGPGPFGYADFGAIGAIDVAQEIQQNTAAQAVATSNADNATWATLSFLVGAAAVTGIWYFYYRPKARRR